MLAEAKPDRLDAAEAKTLARLLALRGEETVAATSGGRCFFAPATAEALTEFVAAHPDATLVARATDVAIWVTKGLRVLDPLI